MYKHSPVLRKPRLYTGFLRNSDGGPRCNESSRKANAKVSKFGSPKHGVANECRADRQDKHVRSGGPAKADGYLGREIGDCSTFSLRPHCGFDASFSWTAPRSQVWNVTPSDGTVPWDQVRRLRHRMKTTGWDPQLRHRCEIIGSPIAILPAVISRINSRVITPVYVSSGITNTWSP